MISPRLGLSHSLAAIVLSATMFGAVAPAYSEENPNTVQAPSREAHKKVWLRFALDKMAERLEIKASQMHAWKAYEAAVEATPDAMAKQPERDLDAARMIQFRADRVNEMGAKLNAIAKATENLQAVLDPEQREVLNEIVRDNLMRPHFDRHEGWGRDRDGSAKEHDRSHD